MKRPGVSYSDPLSFAHQQFPLLIFRFRNGHKLTSPPLLCSRCCSSIPSLLDCPTLCVGLVWGSVCNQLSSLFGVNDSVYFNLPDTAIPGDRLTLLAKSSVMLASEAAQEYIVLFGLLLETCSELMNWPRHFIFTIQTARRLYDDGSGGGIV